MPLVESLQEQIKLMQGNLLRIQEEQIILNSRNKKFVKELQRLNHCGSRQDIEAESLLKQLQSKHESEIVKVRQFFQSSITIRKQEYRKQKAHNQSKIKNRQQTLEKYKRLYEELLDSQSDYKGGNASVLGSACQTYLVDSKHENSYLSSQQKQVLENDIIQEMMCPHCGRTLKPYSYFQHIGPCKSHLESNVRKLRMKDTTQPYLDMDKTEISNIYDRDPRAQLLSSL